MTSSPWRPTQPSAPCSSEVRGPGLGRCLHLVGGVQGLPAGCFLRGPSLGLLSPGAPGRGSSPTSPVYSSSDTVVCHLTHTVPCAHQKPITALKAAAGRLVTGSQDHTLRVSVGAISWALGWPSRGWEAFGGQSRRGWRCPGLTVEGTSWPKSDLENPETDQNLMAIPSPGVPSGGLMLPLHPARPLRGHHDCVH